jgi:hypothetical protein
MLLVSCLFTDNSKQSKNMKNNFLCLGLFIFCLFAIFPAFAQKDDAKTKELKKKWKEKKEDMSIPDFKKMLEERDQLQGEVEGAKRSFTNMKTYISEKDAEIQRLKSEIDSLSSGMKQIHIPTEKNEVDASPKQLHTRGMMYGVQVGAYTKTDFSQYSGNSKNFKADKEGDVVRYILGFFKSLEEAKNFKSYLQGIGIADAWVVGYKDDNRLPTEEQIKINN